MCREILFDCIGVSSHSKFDFFHPLKMIKFYSHMFESLRCVARAYTSLSTTTSLADKLTDFFWTDFLYILFFFNFIFILFYSRCVSTIELSCCDSINYTFFSFPKSDGKKEKKSEEPIKYYLHTFPTFRSSINATLTHSLTYTKKK